MIPIRDQNPRHSWPYVTWGLIAINVAVYAYQASLGQGPMGARFVFEHGFIPARVVADFGDAWFTLISHAFMHGGAAHLFGNLMFLFVFGDNVEDRMGHGRFAIFYLGGAIVAAVAQALFGGDPRTPLIGASGAISAALGAYMMIFPRQHVQTFIPALLVPWLFVRLFSRQRPWYAPWFPAWIYLGYWGVVQGVEAVADVGSVGGGVAWWAHIGGFLYGVALAKILARPDRRPSE